MCGKASRKKPEMRHDDVDARPAQLRQRDDLDADQALALRLPHRPHAEQREHLRRCRRRGCAWRWCPRCSVPTLCADMRPFRVGGAATSSAASCWPTRQAERLGMRARIDRVEVATGGQHVRHAARRRAARPGRHVCARRARAGDCAISLVDDGSRFGTSPWRRTRERLGARVAGGSARVRARRRHSRDRRPRMLGRRRARRSSRRAQSASIASSASLAVTSVAARHVATGRRHAVAVRRAPSASASASRSRPNAARDTGAQARDVEVRDAHHGQHQVAQSLARIALAEGVQAVADQRAAQLAQIAVEVLDQVREVLRAASRPA